MKRFLVIYFFACFLVGIPAQKVKVLKSVSMGKWEIPAANYSGITPLGNNDYAVVDDKSPYGGFYVLHIEMNLKNGKILSAQRTAFYGDSGRRNDDNEDLVYVPSSKTLFITSEENQTVEEYSLSGERTGRCLRIPQMFSPANIHGNKGFEALAYDSIRQNFFLVTEGSLPLDGSCGADSLLPLRIQRYNKDLGTDGQWAYLMEKPRLKSNSKYYTHGVPALLFVGNNDLYVMEREISVPSKYIGAKTTNRIFKVSLTPDYKLQNESSSLSKLSLDRFLPKQEICSFTTRLSLGKMNYGNFEGMCWGPTLYDGRRTILMICDSQNGMGNSFYHLKDYLKVVILPEGI